MKTCLILLSLIGSFFCRGVQNATEMTSNLNAMDVTIDWSPLMENQQPQQNQPIFEQPMMDVQPQPSILIDGSMPQQMPPMPQQPLNEVLPGFMNVSNGADIEIPNVNTVADLISRFWANTWSMIQQDPNSTITLIYAAFKPLEGTDGVHWRLVFCLKGSNNTEFVALDIAILSSGVIDIFRNITTRNLADISLVFQTSVESNVEISMEYLKESFLHNSPIVLNANYDAAQANISGFNIEWTQVEQVMEIREQGFGQLMEGLGGQMEMPETDQGVIIGAGSDSDLVF